MPSRTWRCRRTIAALCGDGVDGLGGEARSEPIGAPSETELAMAWRHRLNLLGVVAADKKIDQLSQAQLTHCTVDGLPEWAKVDKA